MLNTYLEKCKEILNGLQQKVIPVKDFQLKLDELDYTISKPSFWNDPKTAPLILRERQKIFDTLSKLNSFIEQTDFLIELFNLYPHDKDTSVQIDLLYKDILDFEFKQLLNDPIYDNAALLSINAGAGGLEAANWVSMLMRMYLRWADKNGYKSEILDLEPSAEYSSICTDSVSLRINGHFVYGLLKCENGVHRLIRNSPFNSGDARHTSFAAVSVIPDIEDNIEIKIDDKDLEITAQTAGGPGGQNQNRIKSAIRVKHIPTGINILARTERDQLANKKNAMKLLKSKLYAIELEKRNAEQNKINSSKSDISFGHQIRTYTFNPFQLIKDHKSGFETSQSSSFMDGDIDDCLKALLVND